MYFMNVIWYYSMTTQITDLPTKESILEIFHAGHQGYFCFSVFVYKYGNVLFTAHCYICTRILWNKCTHSLLGTDQSTCCNDTNILGHHYNQTCPDVCSNTLFLKDCPERWNSTFPKERANIFHISFIIHQYIKEDVCILIKISAWKRLLPETSPNLGTVTGYR